MIISGCSNRLVDFTIISTKNVDLSKAGTFQRTKMRTEGKDVSHVVLIIPTGVPNMKEAIDKALERIPGAVALVDGVVYSKFWTILVYGQSSYVVEGTPLIDPSLAANSLQTPDYMIFNFDNKGNIKKAGSVTEDEYVALKAKIQKADKKNVL